MKFLIFVILVIAAITGFVFFQKSRTPKPARPAVPDKRLSPKEKRQQLNAATLKKFKTSKEFWGASIETENESNCCQAALAIRQEVFTFDKLPELPLPMCDKTMCMCHYIGRKDRRAENRRCGHDRREEVRFDPEASDRRSGKDRRTNQDVWLQHDRDA